MTILSQILRLFNNLIEFIKNNPKFFLGVIFALLITLLFRQCEKTKDLKNEIKIGEVERQNEYNRLTNNFEILQDSIDYLVGDGVYVRGVLQLKQDEIDKLNGRVAREQRRVRELKEKLKDAEIKSVYVADITSNTSTSDVHNIMKVDSAGNIGIGIADTNEVFSLETETWFNFRKDNGELGFYFVDKFGPGKPSLLNHRFNFSLSFVQAELPDGTTKVYVTPVNGDGVAIPKSQLNIPFIEGVNYIDVQPQTIKVPEVRTKRRGFGLMVGPSYGLYNTNNGFQPTWGIGVTAGYRFF
jgi:hypothetical protein